MKCQCCPDIETSQLICCANQLTGFYMRAKLAFNGLINYLFMPKLRPFDESNSFLREATLKKEFIFSFFNELRNRKADKVVFTHQRQSINASQYLYFSRTSWKKYFRNLITIDTKTFQKSTQGSRLVCGMYSQPSSTCLS